VLAAVFGPAVRRSLRKGSRDTRWVRPARWRPRSRPWLCVTAGFPPARLREPGRRDSDRGRPGTDGGGRAVRRLDLAGLWREQRIAGAGAPGMNIAGIGVVTTRGRGLAALAQALESGWVPPVEVEVRGLPSGRCRSIAVAPETMKRQGRPRESPAGRPVHPDVGLLAGGGCPGGAGLAGRSTRQGWA